MFKDRFGELLQKKGVTAYAVAKATGISQGTMAQYKLGHIVPRHQNIQKIADYFGVSVGYLLGYECDPLSFPGAQEIPPQTSLPIVALASAGRGVFAQDNFLGYEAADAKYHWSGCVFVRVSGDSMSPKIEDGDLILMQPQPEVQSGEIGFFVVSDDSGEGNAYIKRFVVSEGAIALESINPAYPTMLFAGKAMKTVRCVGKAVEIKRKL